MPEEEHGNLAEVDIPAEGQHPTPSYVRHREVTVYRSPAGDACRPEASE